MAMFKEVADVQTADMLNLPVPMANFHIEKEPSSEIQKEMVQSFADRAAKVHSHMVSSDEDNMLLITNDGRKAALDQRLLNPDLPDFEESKVNHCVRNVVDIWKRTAEQKSAQLVFCDLSTPHHDGIYDLAVLERHPSILSLEKNETLMKQLLNIRMEEEKERHDGIPYVAPNQFRFFEDAAQDELCIIYKSPSPRD